MIMKKRKNIEAGLKIQGFWILLGCLFAASMAGAAPVANPITNLKASYHNQQRLKINLGNNPNWTYRVFTLPYNGNLEDKDGNPIGTAPILVPKDASGDAAVYYAHTGNINPDFFIYMVEEGAESDRGMVKIDLDLGEKNQLFSEDPDANPLAMPIASADGFNQVQNFAFDSAILRNSVSLNDFVPLWLKASDASGNKKVIGGGFLVDNLPPQMVVVSSPTVICNSGKHPVSFVFAASDNLGLKKIKIKVTENASGTSFTYSQNLGGYTMGQPITINYDPKSPFQHSGLFNFEFRAVDMVDILSSPPDSHYQDLNFDPLPPQLSFIAPQNNQTVLSPGVLVQFNLSDAGCAGVKEAQIDYPVLTGTGEIVRQISSLNVTNPEFFWATDALPSGNYNLIAMSTDNVGNASSNVTVTPSVSNAGSTPPEARIVIQEGSPVGEGRLIHLDGTSSLDPYGHGLTYTWSQTGGPLVGPLGSQAVISFKTPSVNLDSQLQFSLVVTDARGIQSTEADVSLDLTNDVDLPLTVSQPVPTGAGSVENLFPVQVDFPPNGSGAATIAGLKVEIIDAQGNVVETLSANPLTGATSCYWQESPGGINYQDGPYELHTIVDLGNGGDPNDLEFRENIELHKNPLSISIPGIHADGLISGPVQINSNIPSGTHHFELTIDGDSYPVDSGALKTGIIYTWNPSVNVSSDGPHAIEVTAFDSGGSRIGRSSINIFWDNQPPSLALVSPTYLDMNIEGLYLRAAFIVQAQDPRVNPTDPNGIESVTFVFVGMGPNNSDLVVTKNEDPTSFYEFDLNTKNFPDSTSTFPYYQASVTVTDKAGNSVTKPFSFIIDNANPPILTNVVAVPHPAQGGFVAEDGDAAISLEFRNAQIDLASNKEHALLVFAKQNGVENPITGTVEFSGSTISFTGSIPPNSEVRWDVEIKVNGAAGSGMFKQEFTFIRAMKKTRGGTVTTPDGKLKLEVNAGSLPEDLFVKIENYVDRANVIGKANAEAVNQGLNIHAGPYKISGVNGSGNEVLNLVSPSALSFMEPIGELPPDEQHRVVQIHTLDEIDGIWRPLEKLSTNNPGIKADPPGARAVSVAIARFGIFEVVSELVPSEGIADFFNYPNPFNPNEELTHFRYLLGENSTVSLVIYDLFGNLVRRINVPSGTMGGHAGLNEIPWDGKNGSGVVVGNGGYIVHVQAVGDTKGKFRLKHKVGVLK